MLNIKNYKKEDNELKKVFLVIMSILVILGFSSVALQAEEMTGKKEAVTLKPDVSPAELKGAFGAGIILGSPVGPNVKYWIDSNAAVDFGLGFANDFTVYADFLWHNWKIMPQPGKGSLAGYLGLGVRYQETEGSDKFGFRTVAGVGYWVESLPIEIYLEIVPVFQVSPDTDTKLDGGAGLRYYFARF
jgi:hypothetical protein